MSVLGNGLYAAKHYEDALIVEEAELALLRRIGVSEQNLLPVQCNIASSYWELGRNEDALRMGRDVYFGTLRLHGEEDANTGSLIAAYNYTTALHASERFGESKSLLHKMIPVARRVLDESSEITLKMRWKYAEALCRDTAATLDDVREAVTTLEDVLRIARRVLGPENPTTLAIERHLPFARAALRAREAPPPAGDA